FSDLAHRWWDPESEFRPLHQINPLRLDWIARTTNLRGATALDVGCGGGILTEGLAQRGAHAKGIDLSEKALAVARLHALETGATVDYEAVSAEDLARREPAQYDVVTCMEMLEHVPAPDSTVAACAALLRPGGDIFFSTINRNAKSYLFAIVGAEYLLKLLPRGTHDYEKLIRPAELARWCRSAELELRELIGMSYNPLTRTYSLSKDTSVNYLAHAIRR
ncbi:MAG: bifunctional 2-polyprenyl-6-hydroxyphenol methylase/3-demethylubiquinol 3-O-methyltransferase UbiG, partial [Betaproteobacteria bacterium]|nr:bifunctional 2-polyprenyl-6-hydroxyphenol methylase/3-demethylubiquinol 3-O-methyltransferase UbiG [Betaproteobacteria bacterium]